METNSYLSMWMHFKWYIQAKMDIFNYTVMKTQLSTGIWVHFNRIMK